MLRKGYGVLRKWPVRYSNTSPVNIFPNYLFLPVTHLSFGWEKSETNQADEPMRLEAWEPQLAHLWLLGLHMIV